MLEREWKLGEPAPAAIIAIRITPHGNTHIGVAYKDDDNRDNFSIMHLAFHCDLQSDPLSKEYLYLIPNLETELLELIALRCRKIWRNKQNKRINYAFKFDPEARFDSHGRLVDEQGKGLNCSTFVLAVFASMRIQLVDETTWPPRQEDHEVYTKYLELLKEYIKKKYPGEINHQRHVRSIAPDVSSIRIRPEETAASSISDQHPVKFSQCASTSLQVLNACKAKNQSPRPMQTITSRSRKRK